MFGSQILEVAIGVIFLFILISIICSTIRESIEAWLKTRAAYLEHGIRQLLGDVEAKGLARSFYEHPLISSLYSNEYTPGTNTSRPAILAKGGNLPSYIPKRNFAIALMDIAARGPKTDEVSSDAGSPMISLNSIRMNIANLNNSSVQRALLTAIDSAQGDFNAAQANIEAWYDSSMDRVSGWYKRSTHWILFWIGLVVAIGLNVNTIKVADYLYKNDNARNVLVARATEAAKDTGFISKKYESAMSDLNSLQLPIGWTGKQAGLQSNNSSGAWNNFFGPLLGWLITALAAVMGAPFWFDMLNKVMVIRSTVKPHEKSPEESSEDRQTAPAVVAGNAPPPVSKTSSGRSMDTSELTGVPNIRDADSDKESSDDSLATITTDEQLPPAEGGVA